MTILPGLSTVAFQNALGDFGFLPEEPTTDNLVLVNPSVALGFAVSAKSVAYVEYFGLFSNNLEVDLNVGVFNIGIDRYPTDHLVVDIRFDVGYGESSFVQISGTSKSCNSSADNACGWLISR